VIVLALFLRHARRGRDPFIPANLLHGRGFGIMNLINFLFGAAALGFGALVPLYAEDRFGISVLQAGTLLTARAIGMVCVAGLAVLALRRTGYRMPMIAGFTIIAIGLVGLSWDQQVLTPYAWLSIAAGVAGIGMGMATPASNNAIMQLAPAQIGAISGLRGMFRQGGAIMSISVVTALVARSGDSGSTLAIALVVFAGIIVLSLPLILLVPEHKGGW
jgi:MFS family permease